MAIFTMFTILFLAFGKHGAYGEWPQNTVSTAGSNATIRCSSDQRGCSGIEWTRTSVQTPEIIYKNTVFNDFKNRYSIDNSSGCNLIISAVQLSDAGRFTCTTVMNQRSQERSSFLIVLRSAPTCKVNVSENNTTEGDKVILTCEVSYNGTNSTSVIWKGVNDAVPVFLNEKPSHHSYTIVARAPEVPEYKCVTTFNLTLANTIETYAATNILTTFCKTSRHPIMYSVRNVKLNPSSSFYTPGTTIECAADGDPTPTYKWQKGMNDNWKDIRDGSEFTPSEASSTQYRCFASNFVKGVNYSNSSHTFQVNYTVGIAVGVSLGVLFLVLILILVVCFLVRVCPLYKWRHSKKKSIGHDRMNDVIYRQPLTQTPSNNTTNGRSGQGNNPRPPPNSDPPQRPQMPPPQPQPRAHEESHYAELDEGVQYACLGQEPAIHRNTPHVTEGSEYADITRA